MAKLKQGSEPDAIVGLKAFLRDYGVIDNIFDFTATVPLTVEMDFDEQGSVAAVRVTEVH